jgi:hypothetical protein
MTQIYTAVVAFSAELEDTDWGQKVKISVVPDDPNAPKVYEGNGRIYIRKKPDTQQARYMYSLQREDKVQLLLMDNGKHQWYDFVVPSDFNADGQAPSPATHEQPDIPRIGHTNKTSNRSADAPKPPFGVAMEAMRPEMFQLLEPYYESAVEVLTHLGVEPTAEAVSSIAATAFIQAERRYGRGEYGFTVSTGQEPEEAVAATDLHSRFGAMTRGALEKDKKAASTVVLKAIAELLQEDATIIAGVLNDFGISYDTFVMDTGYWRNMLEICVMYNELAAEEVSDTEINSRIEEKFGVTYVGDEPPF